MYNIRNCKLNLPLWVKWHAPDAWELSQRAEYSWTWKDDEDVAISIPAGYCCDGASIPHILRGVVDAVELLPAAFLHDLLYECHGGDRLYKVRNKKFQVMNKVTNRPWYYTRREADALLSAFALFCGADRSDAKLSFLATRIGGSDAWDDEEAA